MIDQSSIPPGWGVGTITRMTLAGTLVSIRHRDHITGRNWLVTGGGYGPWTDPRRRGRLPETLESAVRAAADLAERRFEGWLK